VLGIKLSIVVGPGADVRLFTIQFYLHPQSMQFVQPFLVARNIMSFESTIFVIIVSIVSFCSTIKLVFVMFSVDQAIVHVI